MNLQFDSNINSSASTVADIIIDKVFKKPIFTWGSGNLVKSGDTRTKYLQGIKEADHGNYGKLISFARS